MTLPAKNFLPVYKILKYTYWQKTSILTVFYLTLLFVTAVLIEEIVVIVLIEYNYGKFYVCQNIIDLFGSSPLNPGAMFLRF